LCCHIHSAHCDDVKKLYVNQEVRKYLGGIRQEDCIKVVLDEMFNSRDNSFYWVVRVIGKTTLGTAGTPIISHSSVILPLTWDVISAHSTAEQLISIPGVAVGDTIIATPQADIGIPFVWSAYVSAFFNSAVIRVANVTPVFSVPATRNWRVDVWKH
jgi:hypothetical protein